MDSDFRILGELEVLLNGRMVDLGSPRQRAVLARLLVSAGETVRTDRLVDDLWPDTVPDTARHALHVYLSHLRAALGDSGAKIERHGSGYRLAIESDELDASRFVALMSEGRGALARDDAVAARPLLANALALWRGDALAEFTDEAFAREEAVRLDGLRLACVELRLSADLELGNHEEVVDELSELVVQHPFRELLWEQLMLALYRCDRQAEALRAFQSARRCLVEELGIEPGPGLRALEDRILAQDPSLVYITERPTNRGPHTLPIQRTSFIGREGDLARADELLEHSRLLTVTGPPGVGKTRFALQLAECCSRRFSDGVFFVPLAAVAVHRLVDRAIAQSLGLTEVQGESAIVGVKAFLRDRDALLILDNFEQVLGAASLVDALLDEAPGLTVMVTSRAPLRISGEQRFPLEPLGLPPTQGELTIRDLERYDAVALFLDRARAVDPAFDPEPGDAAVLAEIATRLDGLPLAIELAAARSRVLTTRELLSHLDRRMLALAGSRVEVGSRHRTLRDAIGWSYELLESGEREFLRCLGVFVGGCTLEAVAYVAGKDEDEVVELVATLMSESLVYRTADMGASRFAMLEMIREFALGELEAAGEKHDMAYRHARYFLLFAQRVEPQLAHSSSGRVSDLIAVDADNLRAALSFTLEEPEPDLGLLIAGSIWRFWQGSERLVEGREWLESLLALPGASDAARASGLMALAGVAYWQGDSEKAMSTYEDALGLYRSLGDPLNVAEALFSMSTTASFLDAPQKAEEFAAQARSLFEEEGSKEGIGRVVLAEGFSRWRRGDFATALSKYEEAVDIARDSGDEFMVLTAAVGVGALSFLLGDMQRALREMIAIIEGASEVHNDHVVVWALDLLASFCVLTAPEESVRLASAADSLRGAAGGGMVVEMLAIEPARSVAAAQLTEQDLHDAWVKGGAMGMEDAVSLAHHLADVGLCAPC